MTAQTNAIRIVQTHDSVGAPAPAEYVQVVENTTVNTLGWDVMQFLKPLTPVRTADPLVFLYTDPSRGSGWLRLEGFRPEDATRVSELVQLDEVARVIGEDPIPKDDLAVGRGALLRSNNPWAFIVLGAVLILFPAVMWIRSPRRQRMSPATSSWLLCWSCSAPGCSSWESFAPGGGIEREST